MKKIFSEGACLLGAFVALALGVAWDHGHFAWRALAMIVAAAALLAVAARRHACDGAPVRVPAQLWAGALVLLLGWGCFDAPGFHLEGAWFRPWFVTGQLVLAGAVGAAWFLPRVGRRWRTGILVFGVVAGLALRVGIVRASPAPGIDVFVQFQESAKNLWAGKNPYRTPVSAVGGDYGYRVTGYAYPPAGLAPQALAWWLAGDIRYAHIAAELLVVAALWALARRRDADAAALLPLLFWFHPRGLFVIEQAWNEPLLAGALAAVVWLAARGGRPVREAVACGIFLSLKQYLIFFAALYLVMLRRWRALPLVAGTVVATWLPFLMWDAPSAVENGLLFQFRTPFRADGLTVMAALHRWLGWAPSKWPAIAAGLFVAALAGWALRGRGVAGWLHAGLLATLAAFLCGSQAFANYYYFIGAGVLLLLALRSEDGAVA